MTATYEQYFVTNHGQGYRLAGSSTERGADIVGSIAEGLMQTDMAIPVEAVVYDRRLGSYLAAMTSFCGREGDARVSYWVHAVLPEKANEDGFMDCLSWPITDYQTEVLENPNPEKVRRAGFLRELPELRIRYALSGQRLALLIDMIWQTLISYDRPSTLYMVLGASDLIRFNETARDIMALVYDLVPSGLRTQLSYLAYAAEDVQGFAFVFRNETDNGWHFHLDPDQGQTFDETIPELELGLMEMLAKLYETDPALYHMAADRYYHQDIRSLEEISYRYYLDLVLEGKVDGFSVKTMQDAANYYHEDIQHEEAYAQCVCRLLRAYIENGDQSQKLLDQYLFFLGMIKDQESFEYKAGLAYLPETEEKTDLEEIDIQEDDQSDSDSDILHEDENKAPEEGKLIDIKVREKTDGQRKKMAPVVEEEAEEVMPEEEGETDNAPEPVKKSHSKKQRKMPKDGDDKGPKKGQVRFKRAFRGLVTGLFYGLLLNIWGICRTQAALSGQVWIIFAGMAGVLLLAMFFMAFSQHVIGSKIRAALCQEIPWAAIGLLLDQYLAFALGDLIMAIVALVVIVAAFIYLKRIHLL